FSLYVDDYAEKKESAVDYSDINEFIEDEQERLLHDLNQIDANHSNGIDEDDDYDQVDESEKTEANHDKGKTDDKVQSFQKDKDGFTIPRPLRRDATNESTEDNTKDGEREE